MRFLSCMMVITFCFLFTFLFVNRIQSDPTPYWCDDYKDHYYIHGTDTTVWYAEAWAGAHGNVEGWFSIWCHVGNGDNDYEGGDYRGGLGMEVGSADVHNGDEHPGEEPTPYFSHSYINGSLIDNTPNCDVCTDGGSCCDSSGGSGSQ